ncbi:transposable element Tcb1 transposase [Trichonephila clavipes]|nr:transposable element Tcb1 transposase [Trichonephila clavipes]
MTGHIYRDVILEQHVRLFRGAMGAEFLFLDENAHSHRANIVDECLQSEDITRMGWPAYSPDLNPIEHVWDILGRRIAAHQPPPTCLPELRRALLDEWCNIPQDPIDNFILSMPRRCAEEPIQQSVKNTGAKIRRRYADEYRCSLTMNFQRTFVRRKTGTLYMPTIIQKIDRYSSGGLKVWETTMSDG